METNLKFNSAICTSRSQSERLLALGLKKETADMCWTLADNDCEGNKYSVEYMSIGQGKYQLIHPDWYTPAWSLHRLLCLLPTEYIPDIDFQRIMQDFIFRSQDMYDEAISCIETLIEEGYFYQEYLKE